MNENLVNEQDLSFQLRSINCPGSNWSQKTESVPIKSWEFLREIGVISVVGQQSQSNLQATNTRSQQIDLEQPKLTNAAGTGD